MPTCPKCKHTWTPEPTWRTYLSKTTGEHYRVHFYSNKGNSVEPNVIRTRLYFRKDTDKQVIETTLRLTAIEHKHDPYFRWCDTAEGTIESVMERIIV